MVRNPVTAVYALQIIDVDTPGEFTFGENPDFPCIVFMCPCGCGDSLTVPICTGELQEGKWLWNESTESATLTPDINRDHGCKFHGSLTDGMWIFAEDSGQ